MRNLCAVMIGSSAISLFAGCFYEQKQQSHLPNLLKVLKLLREWGFTIKRVFADRGFTCFDLVFELLAHKRVQDIRRAYRKGELTVSEAIKQLHIFITTGQPPKKSK